MSLVLQLLHGRAVRAQFGKCARLDLVIHVITLTAVWMCTVGLPQPHNH